MNRQETTIVLATLRAVYPNSFKGLTEADATAAVDMWARIFADDDPNIVAAAVDCYAATTEGGFAPSPGDIKAKIRQLTVKDEMTELEAWGLVQKAVRNGIYGSEEEFAKLPPLVQRLVGSPSQLREWATVDSGKLNTVVASNFQRSFRARAKSEREFSKLPESVKAFVGELARKMNMRELPEGKAT